MGLVTLIYAVISGIVGGLIGAIIITLLRRHRKPNSSVGWDFITFFISFCICGLISAVLVGTIMILAFTGGFN